MALPSASTFDSYGGAKTDYAPAEDPTTDESAAERNAYVSDVAMMTITAPRAMCSFVGHATTPADPSSGFVHGALWGSGPSVKPTTAHTSTGLYTMTFPATVDDPLEVEQTVNLRRAIAQVEQSDGTFRAAHAKVTAANVVKIYTYSGTTLDDLVGQTITVVVW